MIYYNINMQTIRPMDTMLDIWAKSLNCPICNQQSLNVLREAGVPDLLACSACGSEFHFQEGGTHIRLVRTPDLFGGVFLGKWLTYAEVRQKVQQVLAERQNTMGEEIKRVPPKNITEGNIFAIDRELSTEEIYTKSKNQAAKLYELGNSPQSIKDILRNNKRLTEDDIETIVSDLEDKSSSRSFTTTLLSVSLVIVAFFAVVFLFGTGTVGRWASQISNSFDQQAGIIPVTGAASEAVAAICPNSSREAASLFGGKAELWNEIDGAWFYQSFKKTTIYVPGGMQAAYPSIHADFFIQRYYGPMTIFNVYYLTIRCK